jgi:hypothetical protein
MSQTINVSIENYDDWLDLVFAHAVSENEWYFAELLDFDVSNSAILVQHFTRMCREFKDVAETYTLEELNQGIWFLLGPCIEFGQYLLDDEVNETPRLSCIQSMYHVYADVVAPSEVEEMENCFDMWWDMLCGAFWSCALFKYKGDQVLHAYGLGDDDETEDDSPSYTPDLSITITYDELNLQEQKTCDTILQTLIKILSLDDIRSQSSALHGLGHLHHPQVKEVVQHYIDNGSEGWTEDGIEWLKQCRDGTVM